MSEGELSPAWLQVYSQSIAEAVEQRDTERIDLLITHIIEKIEPLRRPAYGLYKRDEVVLVQNLDRYLNECRENRKKFDLSKFQNLVEALISWLAEASLVNRFTSKLKQAENKARTKKSRSELSRKYQANRARVEEWYGNLSSKLTGDSASAIAKWMYLRWKDECATRPDSLCVTNKKLSKA